MALEVEKGTINNGSDNMELDDDGHFRRTGDLWTASAHIITAVIGSGVLSLAWTYAQLGWIIGTLTLIMFSIITGFTSLLLADSYRSLTGQRNYTYMDAVRNNLGGVNPMLCGIAQYANLIGSSIGYLITASISMAAIKRSHCFHKNGHNAGCHTSYNLYMILFGVTQLVLCQIPNFDKLTGLSIIAAVMSFAYSSIGLGLSIAQIAGGNIGKTTLGGVVVDVDVTKSEKIWNSLLAIGNIAFAYAYSSVLIEIQDTIKSTPPEEQTMKKASMLGVSVTTAFYMLCGTFGYAAFGNKAPGNFLTGFGFFEPFWLIDIANICIVIHLVGSYQVFCQPTFMAVETWCKKRWPESKFVTKEYAVFGGSISVNMLRLIWRTVYVIVTTLIAMIFPFFNSILALLGAITFSPLTVYFPVEMYFTRAKIRKYSMVWIGLKLLIGVCFLVSLLAAISSVHSLATEVGSYKLFHFVV